MIKAKHHKFIYPMFELLSRFLVSRKFNSISIKGKFADNGKSVLVIANHISWWDGLWLMILNLKIIKRKFHFMMLEDQLRKHWYFQYSGGYSIRKNSRSVLESINYTIDLLKENENMVFMFPQGRIHSMFFSVAKFENGIIRIIEKLLPETQILFVANTIDFFSDSKPNLFINIKQVLVKDIKAENIENEYNSFYSEVINSQKKLTS